MFLRGMALAAVLKGKAGGVHPNIKICEKSRSKSIAIDFA